MHIKRTKELKLHAPGPDKVTVTAERAKTFLYKEAGLDHTFPLPCPKHAIPAPGRPAVCANRQR